LPFNELLTYASEGTSLDEALIQIQAQPKRLYTQQEIDEARNNLALMNDRVFLVTFMDNKNNPPNTTAKSRFWQINIPTIMLSYQKWTNGRKTICQKHTMIYGIYVVYLGRGLKNMRRSSECKL